MAWKYCYLLIAGLASKQPPRRFKQTILLLADSFFLILSVWGGFAVVEMSWAPKQLIAVWWCLPPAFALSIFFFIKSGLYRAVLRKTKGSFFISVVGSVVLSTLFTDLVVQLLSSISVRWTVWVFCGLFLLILVGGMRWLIRSALAVSQFHRVDRIPVAIYGAGASGFQLLLALEQSVEFKPLAFIDDDLDLHNTEIRGITVYSPFSVEHLINGLNIKRILLSMPSISRYRRQEIIRFLEHLPVHVQDIPSLAELASGARQVDEIREIAAEDLLDRDTVPSDQLLLEMCITNKSVLVTGAGGSIGSELCRQIFKLRPRRLVLLERAEYPLYAIVTELEWLQKGHAEQPLEIIPILGSVHHNMRMRVVLETYGVQTVYHAAAYKHVNIVEQNPIEGVQNNIFGTLRIAQAAISAKVEVFVLISTDKAVRPTSVMGATKRCAELILQALATTDGPCRFSMVRFGNVLGSSGSVVPLFRKQIRRGGPVTVTDPNVTRYFMTVSEATQLVIQAGAMAKGGDVFVLDMGKPVRILDMARRMIQLSGLSVKDENNPGGDIPITFTGLRPGEKLHEELIIGGDVAKTAHPMIIQVQESFLPMEKVDSILNQLDTCSRNFDYVGIKEILVKTADGYQPSNTFEKLARWAKTQELIATAPSACT